MICSILIPSRMRPEKLEKMLESIYSSTNSERFEVLVRLHKNDAKTIGSFMGPLDEEDFLIDNPVWKTDGVYDGQFGAKFFIDEPMEYKDLYLMYGFLASKARGEWLWILNDDNEIEADLGCDWVDQLARVPQEGFMVQPEYTWCNESRYERQEGGPFPCIPRDCWKKFIGHNFPSPVDGGLYRLLCEEKGWQTRFLDGVNMRHWRDAEEIKARDNK